jgi:hypothetical protein
MNWQTAQISNPVEQFVTLFRTVKEAAEAAGVTTEMLRQFRRAGFVSTRARAIRMAEAVDGQVTPAALLGVADVKEAA